MNAGGLLLLLFFTGVVSSEETAVMKRDGETVTLHLNHTECPFTGYLWTYGPHNPLFAITIVTNGIITPVNGTRFGNRLQTNLRTASITISNLTVNDSGIFLAQILTETVTLLKRFNVTVDDNRVIFVNVLEGSSVTLDPGIEKLQKDHTVKWTQGPDFGGTLIAQWKDSKTFIIETLKDVLQLDENTGALTLNNMTRSLAGHYCVKILLGTDPHILRKYFITVYELVPQPHIMSTPANITVQQANDRICYFTCSVTNGPKVILSWYKEKKKLNEISDSDIHVNLTLPLQIQSEPEGIYTCRAANPVSYAAATLNSTQWCPPHHTDYKAIWIPAVVGAVVVVAVLFTLWWKSCRGKNNVAQSCFNMTPTQDNGVSQGSNEGLLPN